jgi:hypothetical protein
VSDIALTGIRSSIHTTYIIGPHVGTDTKNHTYILLLLLLCSNKAFIRCFQM